MKCQCPHCGADLIFHFSTLSIAADDDDQDDDDDDDEEGPH